jgi:hypothetical protein
LGKPSARAAAEKLPQGSYLFEDAKTADRPENCVSFYAIAENFLTPCLGGRAEPIGDDAKVNALTVANGTGNVPGLKDALVSLPR